MKVRFKGWFISVFVVVHITNKLASLIDKTARIRKVQESMEADMNRKLAQQKADSDALIRQIAENYEKKHETYAEALFKAMIKE